MSDDSLFAEFSLRHESQNPQIVTVPLSNFLLLR